MNGLSSCDNAAMDKLAFTQVPQRLNDFNITDEVFTCMFHNIKTCEYLNLNLSTSFLSKSNK